MFLTKSAEWRRGTGWVSHPSYPRYVYGAARVGHASRAAPFGLFGKVPLRTVVATSTDGGRTFGPPVDVMGGVPQTKIFGSFIPEVTVGRGRYRLRHHPGEDA